jgi:hypothetical protein
MSEYLKRIKINIFSLNNVVNIMEDKLYKIIELVGSSTKGFEDAVQVAVTEAAKTLKDLRIVEVEKFDCKIQEGKIVSYRAKVKLSFKYHTD